MKTRKWKKHNYLKRKSRRAAKNRLRRKGLLKKKLYFRSAKGYNKGGLLNLPAPMRFSFIKEPDLILNYFNRASIEIKKHPIFLDLSKVTELTPDAIAIMAALLKTDPFRSRRFSGNSPVQPELKEIFVKSGFYQFVKHPLSQVHFREGNILRYESNRQVANDLAARTCTEAVEHTFGAFKYYPPIYGIIIECMANTKNHADPKEESVHDWWLFLYKDMKTKVSYFSFLDLGVGIFSSLSVKGFIKKALDITGLSDNTKYVKPLLAGEIKSRTGDADRGKGWPFIYETLKSSPQIKNFTLISNNVYANLSSGETVSLRNNFNGTFIYCELHPNI